MTGVVEAEVLIIGGGPAGLGAALSVCRLRKTAIVLQSGKFRNAQAEVMHNVTGFDGVSPRLYVQQARKQIEAYGTTAFVEHKALKVVKTDEGFMIDDQFCGKMLVLATGVEDLLEDIPGLQELWGSSVIHCPFCHGTEYADQAGALLGVNHLGIRVAGFSSITANLKLLTNGEPIGEANKPAHEAFDKLGHETITAKVASLEQNKAGNGVVIHFKDSTPALHVNFVVYAPPVKQASSLAAQLGLDMTQTPQGDNIAISGPFGATSMPGVFACGDAATMVKAVANAAASGSAAGAGAAMRLGFDAVGLKSPF